MFRARDVRWAISSIRDHLAGKTLDDLRNNQIDRLALERMFEILSEAARHLPDEWKAELGPLIPWRSIADLGNRLRHVYHRVDFDVLWSIYKDDLGPLEAAVDAMIERYGPIP